MKFHDSHESTAQKDFKSLCPTCGREVSNAAYFAGAKGSAHFRGTCRPDTWANVKERELERRTLRPAVPYWTPGDSNIAIRQYIEIEKYEWNNLRDLAAWWGLPTIGEASKPKGKAKQALAKMGLAA